MAQLQHKLLRKGGHNSEKYEECKEVDRLNNLNECRDKWVPVYFKDIFFAGFYDILFDLCA